MVYIWYTKYTVRRKKCFRIFYGGGLLYVVARKSLTSEVRMTSNVPNEHGGTEKLLSLFMGFTISSSSQNIVKVGK